MCHGDCRISQTGRFWWPLFDSNFHTVNVIFGWKPTIPENFYIFWEWDEQKNFAIIFEGFDTPKKRFRQRFFSRSTLFIKSFSYYYSTGSIAVIRSWDPTTQKDVSEIVIIGAVICSANVVKSRA